MVRDTATSRNRSWCFTINNYTPSDLDRLQSLEVPRLVATHEVGDSGTPHIQGYIRFDQPVRFSWWKNQFPTAHVEERIGSETQAAAYPLKPTSRVLIDRGTNCDEPIPSRKRTRDEEALEVINEIESGMPYGQIRQRHKLFCFWNRRHVVDYIRDQSALALNDAYVPDRV